MQSLPGVSVDCNIIPLNARMLDHFDRPKIEKAIRKIVRNVHFDFFEQECAIRLLGPDMYYHAFDPHLSAALKQFNPPILPKDILTFRSRGELFDLCFEDSWSGYFIAEKLCRRGGNEDLVLIHLDDHTDMMSALLDCSDDDVLFDPTRGRRFDPTIPADWEAGIGSGSVSIGCFVTPFFFTHFRTHVRHLNNATDVRIRHCGVIRKPRRYKLIPGKRFAAVGLGKRDEAGNVGSYVVSSNCEGLLEALPAGRVIVHVDLDYFINDFNGNPWKGDYVPNPLLVRKARHKLDSFFAALHSRRIRVDQWIVATSPGFCSGCHWPWLLSALEDKISRYRRGT